MAKADKTIEEKPVEWLGDSLDTLKTFPDSVCRSVGFALQFAQDGEKAPNAKPLKGFVALWEQVREKTILLALSFIKQLNQIVSGQMPPPNRSVSCV